MHLDGLRSQKWPLWGDSRVLKLAVTVAKFSEPDRGRERELRVRVKVRVKVRVTGYGLWIRVRVKG
jgi:hypothetical protein